MRKFKVMAITLVISLLLSTVSTFACTAVYVGKEVSTDGSTIIARSEDQGTGAYNKLFVVVDRVENVPGRTMDDVNGFSYPLPATTYQYTMVPDYSEAGDGPYPGACTNEYGLSISATVSASPRPEVEEADPFVEGSLREAVLTGIVAATCKTAEEGVDLLAETIETYGSEEGNVILLADQKEAWIFEVYSGHLWAAQKMPADKVAVFGNQFMIDAVDPADTHNFKYQKDLFTTADKNGWTKKENNLVNLAATFGEAREDYSNMRTWMGHKLLSPSSVGDYATNAYYPLFYKPDAKVSALQVMDVLRNRYEGTKFDASLPGNEELRVIGVERQSQIHVIQIREDYPQEISALQWLAMGNAEHSVFLPNFSGITDTYEAYKVDGEFYNENGAYWKFKRICTLAEQNRSFYGQGVRDYWNFYEEQLYAQMQNAEKEMVTLYKKDPQQAKKYVTDLHRSIAQKACKDADHLYDQLLFFVMDRYGRTAAKLGNPFVADISLRDAAAAKGYTVKWAGNGTPIKITKGNTVYSLTIGEDLCIVTKNGKSTEIKLEYVPTVKDGVTYIPLNFVMTI
ncbi:C69 family dipeptidase [Clostridium aminobutyricum]|uniref:Dipeptidase n=1 Tax=Clostridium aminobutyricum TaxID=33953 RepID=A0A939D8W7_CLOAM|nr:C69 family dipeptidase [Clostridium aminobutyricum]MBN7773280.1 C69 family dipeptidase [Clostridium aminobutyricum]